MDNTASKTNRPREPWNKGKLVGWVFWDTVTGDSGGS